MSWRKRLEVRVRVAERAGHGVGDALVERVAGVVAGRVVGGRERVVAHRLARGLVGLAVLLEAGQRVVAEVVGHVLVDDPAHPGFLQALGVGLPVVARASTGRCESHSLFTRGHAGAGRAVGAGPQEHAVGVGAGVHRAVVGVAQREGVGQRELEGQLGLLEVAHRGRRLVAHPLLHAAAVPGGLAVGPAVRRAADALRVALRAVEVVGQHRLAGGVVLLPDVAAAAAAEW